MHFIASLATCATNCSCSTILLHHYHFYCKQVKQGTSAPELMSTRTTSTMRQQQETRLATNFLAFCLFQRVMCVWVCWNFHLNVAMYLHNLRCFCFFFFQFCFYNIFRYKSTYRTRQVGRTMMIIRDVFHTIFTLSTFILLHIVTIVTKTYTAKNNSLPICGMKFHYCVGNAA